MRRRLSEDDISDIYRATIDDLFDFVARRCDGDRALAEDITQETWLRAVDDWHRHGAPELPAAWLARVASRLISNHRRHAAVERIADADPTTIADDENRESTRERRSMLQRALDRLPGRHARLLEAFHFDRRPVAEIAAADGLSERAVEGRLRRARARLRDLLAHDFSRSDR